MHITLLIGIASLLVSLCLIAFDLFVDELSSGIIKDKEKEDVERLI